MATLEVENQIETIEFQMGRHTLKLALDPKKSFLPNKTTQQFPEVVQIPRNSTVIDLGSGVGPLAIWAALEEPSSVIHAVEIVPAQYELLKKNIGLNGLSGRISPYLGSLYSPLPPQLKADVIIWDVSGIADIPAKAFGWYRGEIPTGGYDGADVTTSAIEQGGRYIALNGSFYFPVGVGVSNDKRIMDSARKSFRNLESVLGNKQGKKLPLTAEQVANLDREIKARGEGPEYLKIGRRKGSSAERAATWTLQIYKATESIN